MPDWVRNIVICNVKTAERLLSEIDGKQIVDFNNLIKMPEHQPDLEKPNPFLAKGNLSGEDMRNFKGRNWYEWSLEKWGCKWNAKTTDVVIDKEQDIAVLDFETPYGRPQPVIEKLFLKTRKDRILWHCEYECDDVMLNIRNFKSNYSKVHTTKQLDGYMDFIQSYMEGTKKQQEWECEM